MNISDADSGEAPRARADHPGPAAREGAPPFGLKTDRPDDRLYREYAIEGSSSRSGAARRISRRRDARLRVRALGHARPRGGQDRDVDGDAETSVDSGPARCAPTSTSTPTTADPTASRRRSGGGRGRPRTSRSRASTSTSSTSSPSFKKLGLDEVGLRLRVRGADDLLAGPLRRLPRSIPRRTNNGAVDWVYQTPATILPTVPSEAADADRESPSAGSMGYFGISTGLDERETGKGEEGSGARSRSSTTPT